MRIEYGYVALKPIKAEHPIGSGTIVEYLPGDPVPAADWGRAEDNLVERGKIARFSFNVEDDGDSPDVEDEQQEEDALHVTQAAKETRPRKKRNG